MTKAEIKNVEQAASKALEQNDRAKARDRKYYVYLANLRNDFYNAGNTEMAIDVQEEINTMGDEIINWR